jgi:ATP-binding cassette subfamily B protein
MLKMIKRILQIAGRSKHRIILGIVFNILKSFAMAMMLLAVFIVFEHLDNMTPEVVYQALWVLLGSIAGRFLFEWLCSITMSAQGFDMFRDYRLSVGDKMKRAPMGYFSEQRLGTIQTILTSTVVELEQYSMLAVTDITGGLSMAVITSIVMAFFSWPIALISLVGLSVGMIVLQTLQKGAIIHTARVQVAQEKLVTESLEYIRGISVLRAFAKEQDSESAVYRAFENRKQAALDQEHAAAGIGKIYSMVFKIASCAVLFAAAALYIGGSIPLSYCLMFLVAAFVIFAELELMGDGAYLARKIQNELNRLETVSNIPNLDLTDQAFNTNSLDIELKDVSFAYDSRTVIDHVSFRVPQGTSCAIIGPSGSGKTTLCNLIARFWDVSSGTVLVGGKNVKDVTSESLLDQISMVFQNVYLFCDTIENNIRFGNPEATREQVVAAAKKARCHDFILAMPNGYDTVVGEGGSTLSGGEKQRISIARAILKNAPIVILDEATSSVDPENEQALLEAIRALTKGKTLISIAHRLNTVRDADQILVIDEGKIVQQGKHDALIKQPGIYRNFLKMRSQAIGWKLA